MPSSSSPQDHLHAGGHRYADRLRDSGAYDREVVVLHCVAFYRMDSMSDRKILTIAKATEDTAWLGDVIKVHVIGPYDVVEYWQKPASNSEDRNVYRAFSTYIDGRRTGRSFSSLDEALVGCVALRHDGINTRADGYFIRSIGADLPQEALTSIKEPS
jgi:hypothetical protein